ncbi:MAG: inorganic diphosphatase, partial [Lachnospiraceae bacterium]|nr:inorganic diphosphatase [Lachnospiraceae bacterium]
TLAFHSPTCTETDRKAALALAEIAEVEVDELASRMFAAGSHLAERSPEEIFYQDYKKFKIGSLTLGVGQINSMSAEELAGIEERLKPFLIGTLANSGINMLFFMLTNITSETSRVLFAGDGAQDLLEEAFGVKAEDNVCEVPRLVSRKKQLIPGISVILQN